MRKTALAIDYVDKKTHHKLHLPITVFQKPTNDGQYKRLVKLLDQLIDEVKGDEKHPLAVAMQIIGDNLELYDNEHHLPMAHNLNEIEIVKYLMKSNGLFQKDLAPIFGGQANVSKFLQGERKLNKKQIEGLKRRFAISADFFIKSH